MNYLALSKNSLSILVFLTAALSVLPAHTESVLSAAVLSPVIIRLSFVTHQFPPYTQTPLPLLPGTLYSCLLHGLQASLGHRAPSRGWSAGVDIQQGPLRLLLSSPWHLEKRSTIS